MTLEGTSSHDDIGMLSFRSGASEYCISIESVREICSSKPTTRLPFSPSHVAGVMNLRGAILPVIDLSKRLGMPAIEENSRNVIIVVQSEDRTAGLLVDGVSDILSITKGELQTSPMTADGEINNFIKSLIIIGGNLLRLLDLSAVLTNAGDDGARIPDITA